jgi:pilus assembly protein FimV
MFETVSRPVLRRLVFLAMALGANASLALSVGEMDVRSHLGEPLRATVPLGRLGSLSASDVQISLASEDVHRSYGIEQATHSSPLVFTLQVDRKGEASVLVSSEQPVGEPYLDFVLEVRWPAGRSLKHFEVLLDPPPR